MNIHFIAIGGAAMHNLAIALHKKGHKVTGSDDEIFEPSRGRLAKYGLLPADAGWNPGKITDSLDYVILGMHAKSDNPELNEAEKRGLKILSFPEFIYEQTRNKTRIVIGGSHGKTTITSMIMHVLNHLNYDFDYLVGSQITGFETMVDFNPGSEYAIIEGDEYLASPLDPRPKFHLYHPDIAVISGIAWDHINVFPTFENYVEQFHKFAALLPDGGTLIYYQGDEELKKIARSLPETVVKQPYPGFRAVTRDNQTIVKYEGKEYLLKIFGSHNLQNLEAAHLVCRSIGIATADFFNAIISFRGAARRLEMIVDRPGLTVFNDFAHSPSKLKATIEAVKEQYPGRKLIACMELHTFSSLRKEFLQEYSGAMDKADVPVVIFNPENLKHKKLAPLDAEEVKRAFGRNDMLVVTACEQLESFLEQTVQQENDAVLLMMSSGNFFGID
ncbi:MAG TPA: Mur ligase family protein, partial [Bacteroidales bacterium]|nr:Mur ligase family protein [Bacteroidales bacterium]